MKGKTTGIRLLVLALLLIWLPENTHAQKRKNKKDNKSTTELSDSAKYHGLKMRNIGPFRANPVGKPQRLLI